MRLRYARLLAGSVLALAVSFAWGQDQAAAGETVRFTIQRFDVSGNTLLRQEEVDAAVAPYTGADRDFGDVQRALEALEALYHARGYNVVTVGLPEQELDAGVVRLNVAETRIGRVTVTGNTVFDEANIRRSLPALVEGSTPNIGRISTQLKLANENPAKKVTLKLRGGENEDEVDADLSVADQRAWKAMLNLDNTGTSATGRTHVSASLQHANLFGRDHVGSIQYTTTAEQPDQVAVYGVGYHIPLYALGDSVDLYANYSDVDSGVVTAGIFDLAVSGRGTVVGGRYNQVLAKRGDYEHRLTYGFDYKAFKNSVLLSNTNFGNDVTVHPLSIGYMGMLPGPEGEFAFSAAYAHNIPGGERGGDRAFRAARAGADPSFDVLRLSASATRALSGRMLGWQARVVANAQLSPDALVPGEQFGAGGSASVRGFAEREVSSDSGVSANLELYSPNWCASSLWQCRGLGFIDAAHAKRNDALPGELRSTTIASAGLGVRIAYGASMTFQLDWGHVVDEGELSVNDKNRVHVRMGFAY
ncbi:MAG TPA: ShlB/FhaC/HecB family hemolysin secretion/activation protein [Telluria sp.]